MPTACGAINADILVDCDNKPVGGAEATIYAINKDDWNSATKTFDSTNPNIVTAITLPSGKKAYKLQVFKRGFKPKFEAQDTDYGVYYKHSIAAAIPLWTNSVKLQIPALAEGYTVFIVENVQKSGGVAFEIYGNDNGLRMPDLTRDLGANEGVVTGTFTNDSDMNESKPPLSFLPTAGTYTATKEAVIALLTPAT